MADALLAGLPRIVRAGEEIRLRGLLALALGLAATAWWTVQWLLDQPVEAARTWLIALVVALLGFVTVAVHVPRRLREGLGETRRPTSRMVYETRADGRDRRIRLSGAVLLTAMVALMFDALGGWGGVVAGCLIGAAVASGCGDLWEARRWERAEKGRESELYVQVSARALVASYGRADIVEVPAGPLDPPMRESSP